MVTWERRRKRASSSWDGDKRRKRTKLLVKARSEPRWSGPRVAILAITSENKQQM